MSLKSVNTVLAAVAALFVLWLGLSFIVAPEASTHGVGLPTWSSGNGDGFLVMKGSRELAMGLVIGVLLVTGHRRALGWVLLMEAGTVAADGPVAQVLLTLPALTPQVAAVLPGTGVLTVDDVARRLEGSP